MTKYFNEEVLYILKNNDFTPFYIQLYKKLKHQILNSEYKKGQMIPSETELMKAYQTTRGTVRNAIKLLVDEGLVEKVQGRGTFVTLNALRFSDWNFSSFTDYMQLRNETPFNKVLEQCIIFRDERSYLKLVRVRGVKRDSLNEHLMLDTSLLPMEVFPGIDQYDFENNSLYQILKTEYETFPSYNVIDISPLIADSYTKNILNLNENEIALMMAEGSVYDSNNLEIEKTKIIYSPKIKFKLTGDLGESNIRKS